MAIVADLSGNAPFSLSNTSGNKDGHNSNFDDIQRSYAVIPSDSVDLPNGACDAIMVTVAGLVKVTYVGGVVDAPYVGAGIWQPMNVKRIWAGTTTATGIFAGY